MKKTLNIELKELNRKLISDDYIKWMNNRRVIKFTEQRFVKNTKKRFTPDNINLDKQLIINWLC